MQFPNDLTSLKELFSSLPQQKIAQTISVLLVGYIALLSAEFTWLMVEPVQAPAHKPSSVTVANSKTKTISTAKIQKLNLFGDYTGEASVPNPDEFKDAPETKLDLTLTGVVATGNVETAAAIIEKRGAQETYGIGEKITGTQATLEKVFHDRVLINASGNLETLMLDGFDFNKTSEQPRKIENKKPSKKPTRRVTRAKEPKQVDHRSNNELSQQAAELKADINNDPSKIGDYLRISPKKVSGEIVGYRLRPGKKSQFFKAAGLKPGDVAVAMNGLDLTNPLEAAQALQALKQEQEISLLIDRNGDMSEILFSVN